MRVGHLQPGRADWYDRTPTAVQHSDSVLLNTPAPPSIFWAYTVPARRKAWLASVFVSHTVMSAPTLADYGYTDVSYVEGGLPFVIVRVMMVSSVPGATERESATPGWMLPPGSSIRGAWGNYSTGGQFEFTMSAMLTEFDA